LPLLIAKVSRREAEKRVTEICAWLELPRDASLSSLTVLEQQRWSLARALVHEPKLLLVDGLDELEDEAESFITELLEKTSLRSLTTMFTTRQARIAAYGEQIFTLQGSKLQASSLVESEALCGN
jgi:ABC-type lipoprotein export system ATPase subunit